MKNKVQLITYPDSLGGDLKSLEKVLDQHFPDLFSGGIHILPPYPSSGDRGFSPITYFDIDPQFGSWDDLKHMSKTYDIMLDLMVNHISAESKYFQGYMEKGDESEYRDLFLPVREAWSGRIPTEEEIENIFLRRDEPFSDYKIGPKQEKKLIWTSFGKDSPSHQVDLNVNTKRTRGFFSDIIMHFNKNGVKCVRLDAVGYVIKKIGTSCFFVEPEIFDFLSWMNDLADKNGIELLPEVHAEYATQLKLVEKGYWIYDFILPYLILESIITKKSGNLIRYLRDRPSQQITMLDCHDGVPVIPDLNGFIDIEQARKVVDICLERGGDYSVIYSSQHKQADGFDVHQIMGTYYSLLDGDDDAYLLARAIQFFTPGIPQIYYVGLLAGENDNDAVLKTGEKREINRHNYSLDEIEQAVEKPVVQKLIKLLHFRNEHPAFDGECTVNSSSDTELSMTWKNGDHLASLSTDLWENSINITYSNTETKKQLQLF
ncbi:MAG: sucrose phosphorylase [Chloroflexota bacterium]|jgi:sucrose phosphorylase|nr:sucrose phosphorylase [Chloroflexota bacterium]